MSHYTVAVITKNGNYDKALAPYDEDIEVEPYIEKTKEEIIIEMRDAAELHKNDVEQGYDKWMDDSNFYDENGNLIDEVLYQHYRKGAEEFENIKFDEEGNQLSTYNPKSRWDWYQEGGRWDCQIMRLKNGTYTNHAQVKDIDFSPEPLDDETLAWCKRFWEINVEGAEPKDDDERGEFADLWTKEYYLERYGTFEKYIEFRQGFYTHAFILDGEWYESGKMGWWAIDDSTKDSFNEYHKKLLEVVSNLDPNDWVTIVDCHI